MCTDFAPTVQKKCHERIVPALLGRLIDLSTPRVAAHAGAAIVNFCEDCPKRVCRTVGRSDSDRLSTVLAPVHLDLFIPIMSDNPISYRSSDPITLT